MPVDAGGGLIANGEPIDASGLRQMHEPVRQLRAEASGHVLGNQWLGPAQVYARRAPRHGPSFRPSAMRGATVEGVTLPPYEHISTTDSVRGLGREGVRLADWCGRDNL
ncbi:hypothetical protein MSHI_00230 [Mycobacterium shinjukuense]|uniref:Uncharacterized protein n=1 Tax=Mycobacterium shinjukuense TaxID=398694 RepID=A0A7I7MJY5_9MYCO|nr:hypothetical protein MSHI_00230 [Mycobacterium shinjukuense]